MSGPDAERGPRQAPGPDPATATGAESENDSNITALAVDPYGVVMLDRELRELLGGLPESYPSTQGALTDAERLAMALADTFGPTWARRLALELLEVSAEMLAARSGTWGGDGG